MSASATEVNAKDGIVTLRGDAASQAQRDLTTEYAKDIDGVKDVKNEMVVSSPSKKKRTIGEKIEDASTAGYCNTRPAGSKNAFPLVLDSDYSMAIRFFTTFTPFTSLANLVAKSFSAAFFALPPNVTTPFSVVTEVLRALVER